MQKCLRDDCGGDLYHDENNEYVCMLCAREFVVKEGKLVSRDEVRPQPSDTNYIVREIKTRRIRRGKYMY